MKIKNLIYIPYHDWRKIEDEGNRTRDAHFIEKFRLDNDVERLIIINRPLTYTELLLKKKKITKALSGEIIFRSNNFYLYKIDHKTYIIDSFINQNIKIIFEGRKWLFKSYGNKKFKNFVKQCFQFLGINKVSVISANIFSSKLFSDSQQYSNLVFDAWDNFYLMPGLSSIKSEIYDAYRSFAEKANVWVTNSEENRSFFGEKFEIKNIEIIKNGVDFEIFNKKLPIPEDLKKIRKKNKPIVGFGGKITHLFDYNLFNYVAKKNPEYSFVIIGQILDKKVFSNIDMTLNVYYLGDKKYDIYPNYLSNFDLGIIPYRIGKKQHGGDSIKVYEYLSAGLPAIGTRGNGLQDLEDYIYLADTKEAFSEMIKKAKILKKLQEKNHSWRSKEKKILSLLNSIN